MTSLAVLAIALAFAAPARAVQPDEILKDPVLEERARALSAGLRCLVCQNQSIDDSDAPLARDLRLIVRERLVAGDTDASVKAYVTARYGEFVLLSPPFNAGTVLLWGGPFAVLALGGLLVWRQRRKAPLPATVQTTLSTEEQARLDRLLQNQPD
ncbi:MAG: cytochrome c-type biogenesis protein [Bosea sp. (in: a-proteobacteria)]